MEKTPTDNATPAEPPDAKNGPKKLGISKNIYSFGVAARDSMIAFAGFTTALFPVVYFGQGKSKIIDSMLAIPEKVNGWAKDKLHLENSGKIGRTLALSGALGFLLSHAANIPGLIYGRKVVDKAEALYNAEIEDNKQKSKEIAALTETVKRQGLDITEARTQIAANADQRSLPEAANDPASADQPQSNMAARFARNQGLSNAEQVMAARTAQEQSVSQKA